MQVLKKVSSRFADVGLRVPLGGLGSCEARRVQRGVRSCESLR